MTPPRDQPLVRARALICLSGYRLGDVLSGAARLLHLNLAWLLHVVDERPIAAAEQAAEGLMGRSALRSRMENRLRVTAEATAAAVEREATAWLALHRPDGVGRFVHASGRVEHEIVRIAEEWSVDLVLLGASSTAPNQIPPPPEARRHDAAHPHKPIPPSPVIRIVTDHAHCDILLLHHL